ncbi:MAG: HI0074 family nucleotidyltransferase substrate-binding subunit [Armatimonadetes bacterium]|nr:HI0074 family nucleotidyltransferase substrate-binding subunit [Armatimonadota bacterium]
MSDTSYDQFQLRRDEALRASARLLEAVERCADGGDDMLRDALIQRFEFTFEATWKAIKSYVEHLGLEAGSPRQAIRALIPARLADDEDELDAWFNMLEDRNLTSHTYIEALSVSVSERVARSHAPRLSAMAERLGALAW